MYYRNKRILGQTKRHIGKQLRRQVERKEASDEEERLKKQKGRMGGRQWKTVVNWEGV